MNTKIFRKSDAILIAAVIVIAAACILIFKLSYSGSGDFALITVDGEEYAELPLSDDAELDIVSPCGINHLVIQSGEVYVSHADCPNQVCVNTGKISEEGELIVCLPHKVVITIESK